MGTRYTRFTNSFLEATPPPQSGAVNIQQPRTSAALVDEDDELEDELLLPEAFTQPNVESPNNTSTGTDGPHTASAFFRPYMSTNSE